MPDCRATVRRKAALRLSPSTRLTRGGGLAIAGAAGVELAPCPAAVGAEGAAALAVAPGLPAPLGLAASAAAGSASTIATTRPGKPAPEPRSSQVRAAGA